ncbi:MAG: hypothetical protein ACRCUY_00955 [Thermoguttaceae bacterium]
MTTNRAAHIDRQDHFLEKKTQLEQRIESRIEETCRIIRFTDFALAVVSLITMLFAGLFIAILADHWLFRDGIPVILRVISFAGFFGFIAVFSYCWILPLLFHTINPVYAAKELEQNAPAIKNTLINWLLLRREKADSVEKTDEFSKMLANRMIDGLTKTAANRVESLPAERAVDRHPLLFWGVVLTMLIVSFLGYSAISSKSPVTSMARMVLPLSSISAPQSVSFGNVKPGDETKLQGETTTISVEVVGKSRESVYLFFSTDDGQAVKQAIPMSATSGAETTKRGAILFESAFPPGKLGFVSGVDYWFEQGKSRSRLYRIDVRPVPTLEIEQVRYQYPEYTGLAEETLPYSGDIRAVEGTELEIFVRSTVPLEKAQLQLGSGIRTNVSDESATEKYKMLIDRDDFTKARVSLKLERNTNGSAAAIRNFSFHAIDLDGVENNRGSIFRVEILPDKPPVVQWSDSSEELREMAQVDLPLNGSLELPIQAEDIDFSLRELLFHVEVAEKTGRPIGLLESKSHGPTPHTGLIEKSVTFEPNKNRLKEGDTAEIWAEAIDSKLPEANTATTRRIRINVIAPTEQPQQKNQKNESDKNQNQNQRQNQNDSEQDQSDKKNQKQGNSNEQENPSQEQNSPNQQNDTKQDGEKSGNKNNQENPSQEQNSPNQQNDTKQDGEKSGNKNNQENSSQEQNSPNQQNNTKQDGEKSGNKNNQENPSQEQNSPNQQNSANKDGEKSGNKNNQENPSQEQNSPNQQNDTNNQNGGKNNGDGKKGDDQQGANNQQDNQQSGKKNESDAPIDPETRPGDAMKEIIDQMQKENGKNEKPSENSSNKQENPSQEQNSPNQQNGANKDGENSSNKNNQENPSQEQNSPNQQNSANKDGEKSSNKNNQGNQNKNENPQKNSDSEKQNSTEDAQQKPCENGDCGKPDCPNGACQEKSKQNGGGQEASPGNSSPESNAKSGGDQKGNSNSDPESRPGYNKQGDTSAEKQNTSVDPNDTSPRQRSDELDPNSKDRLTQGGEESNPKKSDEKPKKDIPHKSVSGEDEGKGAESKETGRSDRSQSAESGEKGDESGEKGVEQSGGKDAKGDSQKGESAESQAKQTNETKQTSDAGKNGTESEKDKSESDQSIDSSSESKADSSKGGNEQSSDKSGSESNSGTPSGGNSGSNSAGKETERESANLEYSQQVTNLALEYLEEQMKETPNPELLKRLGWNEEQLRQFAAKWRTLLDEGQKASPDSQKRKEMEESLKSLGLKPAEHRSTLRKGHAPNQDSDKGTESHRTAPPTGLEKRFKQYTHGISK